MTAPFKHFAQLTAGSAVEAIMNTAGGGEDGHFFTVPKGQVVRVRLEHIDSEHTAGMGRLRIRRSALDPQAGPPALVAADEVMHLGAVPLGGFDALDMGSQPIELPGGTQFATGTNYYLTIDQPGGLGFACVTVNGQLT